MFEPLCEKKEIDLQVDAAEGVMLEGNADLLTEMVANLLDNAVRFTPAGGKITVELDGATQGRAVLTVSDTGPGIAENHADYVFERFAQVQGGDSSGSGLGLAIVAEIARTHGGHAQVLSGQGQGAVFRVTFG